MKRMTHLLAMLGKPFCIPLTLVVVSKNQRDRVQQQQSAVAECLDQVVLVRHERVRTHWTNGSFGQVLARAAEGGAHSL